LFGYQDRRFAASWHDLDEGAVRVGVAAKRLRREMFFTALLVVLHVFAAGWFVAGVVGRNVSSAFARRATTIEAAAGLLRATEYFDTRMVIPGSGLVLILGLAAAWAADWPIL